MLEPASVSMRWRVFYLELLMRMTPEEYEERQAVANVRKARRNTLVCAEQVEPALLAPECDRAGIEPATVNKYRNVKTDGYASKKEAKRAAELKLMLAGGKIRDLKEQERFELIPKQEGERACHYVADFVYAVDDLGMGPGVGVTIVVEDCKGMRTPEYIIKRKLFLQRYGFPITEI